MSRWARELEVAERLVWDAGALVLARFCRALQVDFKAGDRGNPVTDADRDANDLIVDGLAQAFPDDAILAEESHDSAAAGARRRACARLWCVDPIDGTREFVAGGDNFAVMVGLATAGRAALGLILQPTRGRLIAGGGGRLAQKERRGADWRPLTPPPPRPLGAGRVAVSRRHPPARLLEALAAAGFTETLPMGSIGLKMAAVAAGEAELYASLSTTMCEWDTCAPEAICAAAGAEVGDLEGSALAYNKAEPTTPGGILAARPPHDRAARAAIRELMGPKS